MHHPTQPASARDNLGVWLRRAIVDGYARGSKASRDYPRVKKEQPTGPPHIRLASKSEAQMAQAYRDNGRKGLTA
jgi:hypothetical protein